MRGVADRDNALESPALADVVVDRHRVLRLNDAGEETKEAVECRNTRAQASLRQVPVLGTVGAIDGARRATPAHQLPRRREAWSRVTARSARTCHPSNPPVCFCRFRWEPGGHSRNPGPPVSASSLPRVCGGIRPSGGSITRDVRLPVCSRVWNTLLYAPLTSCSVPRVARLSPTPLGTARTLSMVALSSSV